MIADLIKQLGIDVTFFVQLIIFLVVFTWLRLVYFSPFLGLIKKRQEQSEGLGEKALLLHEEAKKLEAQHTEVTARARKDANEAADKIIADGKAQAASLISETRKKVKTKLEEERKGFMASVSTQISELKASAGGLSDDLVRKLTNFGSEL